MDIARIRTEFENDATPLIRTDFSDDEAWRVVTAKVSAPVDFEDPLNSDPGDGGYNPHITAIDDRSFEAVTGTGLAEAMGDGEIYGYVLLADARSMAEATAGGEITVDYVNLTRPDPEFADEMTFPGHTFRVSTNEVASIEANLSIANMDFEEFAESVQADGVFRGFTRPDGL